MGGLLSYFIYWEEEPTTADATILYEQSLQSCKFDDKNYFLWRMRQLEIINYAIVKMNRILKLPAEQINYELLINDILTYGQRKKPADQAHLYDFDLLARDNGTFKGMSEDINQFAVFQDLANKIESISRVSPTIAKQQMEDLLASFNKLREGLVERLKSECLDA